VSGEALVEIVFMMVILKIPVVYLGLVVYWAIRSEPRPPEPAPVHVRVSAPDGGDAPHRPLGDLRRSRNWRPRPGPRARPHGAPMRTYARGAPTVRSRTP